MRAVRVLGKARIAFSCVCAGGFGGNVDHDPHLLSTLSAIQILAMYDRLAEIDTEAVVRCARRSPHAG